MYFSDGPNHTLSLLLNSFEDAVKTSLKQEFEFKTKVKTNRIQKTFIRFIHKASCMHCTVQFDSDTKMESSMVIIRGFISHKPYCKFYKCDCRTVKPNLIKMNFKICI